MTYCYGLSSGVVHRALTSSSQELLGNSLPILLLKTKETEDCNFMPPSKTKCRLFWGKKVKLMYFSLQSSNSRLSDMTIMQQYYTLSFFVGKFALLQWSYLCYEIFQFSNAISILLKEETDFIESQLLRTIQSRKYLLYDV